MNNSSWTEQFAAALQFILTPSSEVIPILQEKCCCKCQPFALRLFSLLHSFWVQDVKDRVCFPSILHPLPHLTLAFSTTPCGVSEVPPSTACFTCWVVQGRLLSCISSSHRYPTRSISIPTQIVSTFALKTDLHLMARGDMLSPCPRDLQGKTMKNEFPHSQKGYLWASAFWKWKYCGKTGPLRLLWRSRLAGGSCLCTPHWCVLAWPSQQEGEAMAL